jgi:BirA family transcriptional regulator, biotin operon repressor / biotin---[acetyl-CoA-carboxylase] ligase
MMAFALTVLMFSLAGIPPLAGFFAKWYVFLAAINAGLYALAVIGVLASRGRCLLLSAHHQDHVVRRAGGVVRIAANGADLAEGGRLVLKWPNDLLFDGGKLSGILLESRLMPEGRLALAIGIGVNVVTHPEGLPYAATSLRHLGVDCTAEEVFLALSDAWTSAYDIWRGPGGQAEIRRRWLASAAGAGTPVAVNLGGRVLKGTFETIDADCRFVIRTEDGTIEAIAAGDVHFGAVATTAAV